MIQFVNKESPLRSNLCLSLGTIRLLRPRGWFAEGVQFSKRLEFFFFGGGGGGGGGGQFFKFSKCEGGRNIKSQDWPSMQSCYNISPSGTRP